SNVYEDFLDAISRGTKDDVERFLRQANSDECRDSRDEDPTCVSHKRQLTKALEDEDAVTVWKLIARAKESELKTIENLNKTCETVAENECLKEKGLIKYLWESYAAKSDLLEDVILPLVYSEKAGHHKLNFNTKKNNSGYVYFLIHSTLVWNGYGEIIHS
ncbi:unnamed protein product, partial [Pocillopora meandrina]